MKAGCPYIVLDPIGAIQHKVDKGERIQPENEVILRDELTGKNGKQVANAFMNDELAGVNFVLDLSGLDDADRIRFVDGLCRQILKENTREMVLLADEVHEVAPQRIHRGQVMSSGQFIRLCSLGRNKGPIGIMVASQRMNKVATDVRELNDVFVFHKLTYSISLKACDELLRYHVADKDERQRMLAQIQGLGVGETYFFDPSAVHPDHDADNGVGEKDGPEEVIGQVRAVEGGDQKPIKRASRPAREARAANATETPATPVKPTRERTSPPGPSVVGKATGGKWKANIVATEPAAAQTATTRLGRHANEIFIDDDFPPEDLHGLTVHEATEEMGRREGLTQQEAHAIANEAERAAVGDEQFEAETARAQTVAANAQRGGGKRVTQPPRSSPRLAAGGRVQRVTEGAAQRGGLSAEAARRVAREAESVHQGDYEFTSETRRGATVAQGSRGQRGMGKSPGIAAEQALTAPRPREFIVPHQFAYARARAFDAAYGQRGDEKAFVDEVVAQHLESIREEGSTGGKTGEAATSLLDLLARRRGPFARRDVNSLLAGAT